MLRFPFSNAIRLLRFGLTILPLLACGEPGTEDRSNYHATRLDYSENDSMESGSFNNHRSQEIDEVEPVIGVRHHIVYGDRDGDGIEDFTYIHVLTLTHAEKEKPRSAIFDADGDGLPDEENKAHEKLVATENHSNLDEDNIQSTAIWPKIKDADGDGIADGSE